MIWLVLTLLVPLLLLLPAPLAAWRARLPLFLAPAALPALVLGLTQSDTLLLELPWLLTGLEFGMDGFRRTFVVLAGLMWTIAGAFAVPYLRDDPRRGEFAVFWLLTLTGKLMLVVAFDLVAFYTGFALMTFAGYGLVIHTRTEQAIHAGRIYLVMALIGEGALLAGLFMVGAQGETLALAEIPQTVAASETRNLLVGLFIIGFGVKAGLALLQLWLPLAHPVAPTPASAILSGVMIKAGLLGWMLVLPFGLLALTGWGTLLVLLGALGSFGGALIGITQTSDKAILAYSSVSQMGLLIMLLGVALAVPDAAPMLLAGVAFYALHHGLAKGSLFFSTAAMARPGGIRGAVFWLAAVWPGLTLMGLPLTSGAAAKIQVKYTLPESSPDFWIGPWVEWLLMLGAVGTTVLVARFLVCLWHSSANRQVPDTPLSSIWLVLVAVSAVAVWWLPRPAGIELDPGLGPAAQDLALPILAGGVLVLLAWFRPLSLRVPPGDLIVPVERLLRGIGRRLALAAGRLESQTALWHARAQAAGQRVADWNPTIVHLEQIMRRKAVWLFIALMLVLGAAFTF